MQDFEKIYVDYLRDVYNFLLKLSGSEDIAEELTQSTFSIAFENLGQFRGTCKMSVWLCQIAKHEYFAYCKRQRPIVREEAMEEEPCGESLEERFIDHAEQIRIHEVLHVLPEPYKEVFTLRVMAELSYKDISRLFGKSESWARVTYYRAKCMIVERLEGGGKDEV
ncbi:sigma-70 family RNA polymerase sigma factor [Lachnospiraceae bacterium MD308]|nr:sigma-70 family RNA polymerase sigma factor [Lachnospiraceae bacterium MD308]